ncbi:MFS transporter [Stappia stellulata]|uniref:MFS transporter n=1 Tax=Stappia stellulata TaxID=71235 RepID=UPI001CD2050F|nr:MFS transporter [Stappia stellulata]MCA1243912.1 MFS transporter [Stappia stellulata]
MTDTPRTRTSPLILLALASATLTAALGISIASVLLPTLSRSYGASVSQVQWVVLAYLMSMTVAVVSAGRLGDTFGHRRVLLSGLAVFVAGSLACATAPGLEWLILGRAVQGLGAAILIALPMSIARDMFSTARLGTSMGVIATMSAIGTALGPSVGGALLAWGDWRMTFHLLAGAGLVTFVLAAVSLGPGVARRRPTAREMDIPGTFLLMIAVAAYALATSGGAVRLPVGPAVLIPFAALAAVVFATIETRVASPLVPMHLLRDRKTGIGFVMNMIVGTIMMSTLVIGPFFLAFALGLNEALVGLVMAVGPAVASLAGIPAGRLTDRLGAKRVVRIGLAQIAVGLLCLAVLPRYFGVGGYVAALFTLTPAFQLFLAANNTTVLLDASPEQRGRLSGLLGLSRNLGLMTGASLMPSVFVAILGTGDAAHASGDRVAHAFSMTFTAAAGVALLALGLAAFSQSGRAAGTSDPAR